MKIKISPCFWCGRASRFRAIGPEPHQTFNACEAHGPNLTAHARLLFTAYSWHTAEGLSFRFKFDERDARWGLTAVPPESEEIDA